MNSKAALRALLESNFVPSFLHVQKPVCQESHDVEPSLFNLPAKNPHSGRGKSDPLLDSASHRLFVSDIIMSKAFKDCLSVRRPGLAREIPFAFQLTCSNSLHLDRQGIIIFSNRLRQNVFSRRPLAAHWAPIG